MPNLFLLIFDSSMETNRIQQALKSLEAHGKNPVVIRPLDGGADAMRIGSAAPIIEAGQITIDTDRYEVFIEEKPLRLTRTQYLLLLALMQNRGKPLSRDRLVSEARGSDAKLSSRAVDFHISTLRNKLGKCGNMIETVRGVGYRCR